jgi:ComF family protein
MVYRTNDKIKALINNAVDIVFPHKCLSCKEQVESDGSLCHICWEEIEFITTPQCFQCGTPFEIESSDLSICGQCISNPPKYSKARALFCYNEKSSRIITSFKYYDNTHYSKHFAKWLIRTGNELIKKSDIITPVPLHKLRMISRRYNQSALICNQLGIITGKNVNNEILIRHKNTKPQAGLTFKTRIDNVKSAFRINNRYKNDVVDKTILLVDDVMTTGSTINACTKTLLKAGAREVFVLTIAATTNN